MANSAFKTAFDRTGMTVDQFAKLIEVDRKTVERWIAGRTPYRNRRVRIARALDVPVHELWPDEHPAPRAADHSVGEPPDEIVRSWGGKEEFDAGDTFTRAQQIIDVLAPALNLISNQSFVSALGHAADRGCQIRILAPTDAGQLDRIATLTRHHNIELRVLDRSTGHTVFRADDFAFLGIWLAGEEGQPFLLAQRRRNHGVFDTITSHFDKLWNQAQTAPVAPAVPAVPGAEASTPKRVRRWPRAGE
jgi:lambda repressor-like predicted transcriptional regulator